MDKAIIRNILFFLVFLSACAGCFGYVISSYNQKLNETEDLINHTHQTIIKAEELAWLFEAMISSQRGYMLSGKEDFLSEYEIQKANVSEHIANLNELTSSNESQTSRLDEIRTHFNEISVRMENRSKEYRPVKITEYVIGEIEIVNGIKNDFLRINTAVLKEERRQLKERMEYLHKKRNEYYQTLIIGGLLAALALVIFNGTLFYIQVKRIKAERSLKDTEERFALAVEGTNDGIFDWNIQTGEVFYSKRFFGMLGYDRDSFIGTIQNFTDLIHPDDAPRVWQYMERYLHREVGDYSNTFRMKNADGGWTWINARAKAIFNRDGQAMRMVTAQTDITIMKEYQEKLKDEKHLAEKANRAKSDFLAHMSHEIRTPLTAISGVSEILLKNGVNLTEKQSQLVKTLHSSTSGLKDIVNDILDFSKIESGELELEETTFRLGDVFQQVISIMAVNARQKGLAFLFDFETINAVEFFGDPLRLRQILINLIGNAIKFTANGTITVKAAKEDRNGSPYLRIDVIDTGIGIAPENHEMIFERFKQADSSVSRKYGGTGLGLPISRNLALLMGGNITLKSAPGEGATFTVALPVRALNDSNEESEEIILGKKLSGSLKASLSGEKRVLLVEDYEGNIVVISHILEDLGCAHDVARTGVEALNLWKEKHYDLILMDIQMPEMDGITATAQIRKMETENGLRHTPIIGMTAHALVGDKDKCIAAGMDAYLPKPIVETDLKAKILKFLSLRRKKAA